MSSDSPRTAAGQPVTAREHEFDQRSLTEDQRYLAEDIATSMPDGHEGSCGVWSEDGDGCDCHLVLSVANGLHAARIVAVEAERGWDSAIGRGERVVRLPFRPMPVEAASPAASGDAPHPIMAKYGLESMQGDPLVILERHLVNNHAATLGGKDLVIERLRQRLAASPPLPEGLDVPALLAERERLTDLLREWLEWAEEEAPASDQEQIEWIVDSDILVDRTRSLLAEQEATDEQR